jgi:hypothetical protein
MTFSGTLIEDLMATVERAEQRAQSDGASILKPLAREHRFAETLMVERSLVEPSLVEPWFASVQENAHYDRKFFGVA